MRGPENLAEALDQCLLRLQRGDAAEACLAAYPALGDELRPLLAVAQELQALATERPHPAPHLAAGRQRFLAQAAQMRARAQGARPRPLAELVRGVFTPLLRRGVASTLVATALVVVLLAGTSMIASANSLPGDPLYPVKRAAESVQLALVFNEESRASLQRSLDERRIQEARAVVDRHRVTEVSFRGPVDAYDGQSLVAAGLVVQITPTTALVGPQPAPGRFVAIVALSRGDGQLVAQLIETLEATPVPPRPTRQVTRPPLTPVLLLTPTSTAAPGLQATGVPRVTDTAQPPATQAPQPTRTASPLPTQSATPARAATPTPPREVEIRFEGAITQQRPGLWQIAGHDVRVTSSTRIDETVARAEVGAWVVVKAIRDTDGSLVALQIAVQRGAETPGEIVEFQGTIEALGPSQWTVAGQVIEVTGSTSITGEPHVGWLAEVRARRLADGTLRAIEIVVRAPQEIPVEFVGLIEQIAADRWVIAGYTVRIDAQTVVHGQPAVGLRAEVQGLELADGTVRALVIRVRAPTPSPSPSPTVAVTLTPTATRPTLTPTPLATSTQAPDEGEPTVAAPPATRPPTESRASCLLLILLL